MYFETLDVDFGNDDGVRISPVEEHSIMTIAEVDPLNVEVILPEEMYGLINVGTTGEVTPRIRGGEKQTTGVVVVDKVIDAASNTGVDNIRDLIANANYRPARARFKIYIIDEVHMLSTGAFNALLKTLEEPTPRTILVLVSAHPDRLPGTIRSRCQALTFRAPGPDSARAWLQDQLPEEPSDRLDALLAVLPCMRQPTVSQLAAGAGFAVKAAVPRKDLPVVIPQLKAAGGEDIVVTRLAQIIP